MNNMILENIFYLGTFPFIAAIFHHFFSNCLGCRIKKRTYIILIYSLYCLVSGGLYLSPLSGGFNLLLNFSLLILISYLYKSSLKWRLGATVFIIAIIFLSDMMVQSLLIICFPTYATEIYIVSLFLSKMIMLILVQVAIRLFISYGEGYLSGWYWSFLIFCPFISFFGLYGLSRYFYFMESPWLYSTISILLLFINFFVFILCDHVLRLQIIQTQNLLLEQQINYYTHQYLLAESAQKETLKLRHDIKNILVGLRGKLGTGDITESQQDLDKLIGDFNLSKGVAHSGNLIIDSIINYKQQTAESFNISFYLDLRLSCNIKLDSTVISVILGNALDNAIEACQQMDSGKRYIKIQMHYKNESLFICIENPYDGHIRTDISGKIRSTKSDHKLHGIGLKSISTVVEKINGLLDITFNDDIFKIEIVLFNIKKED